MSDKTDKDILAEIKSRFKEAYDAADSNYRLCIEDLEFENGNQWPQDLKADRQAEMRPCLVLNKVPAFIKQVTGDIRQNEPGIKIRGVDSKADPKTAEIIGGLIKNIENQSEAEIVFDTAAEMAVKCGIGAWRVVTEYADDDTFDQDIRIKRMKNPFTIYWDPAAQEWNKQDAQYCFITEKIPRWKFEEDYPDAALMPFEGGKDSDSNWGDDKNIRIVEYFKKVPKVEKIWLVKTPQGQMMATREKPPPHIPGFEIVKEREVDTHKIVWYKATQSEIVEGPTDWPGYYIPIVMVYGEEVVIENKTEYRGLVRFMKDPQRLYNYSRSMGAEVTSLAPKAPYLVTAAQISNYKKLWDVAHKRNLPYLPYDVDPMAPGAMPKRAEPIGVNTGIREEIMISDQELHDTAGLQQASLGEKSNEKSGKAILARQREGDRGNFHFADNLGRAIKFTAKVIIDLIPKIYDTARVVRIVNPDDTDSVVPINQPFSVEGPQGPIEAVFDVTVGKYDVVVTLGPSTATKREEAAAQLLELIAVIPEAGPLVADMIAKNLDFQGAQEIERRLKMLLPPALQGGDGSTPPAPPPPPSPNDMIAMRGAAADVQGKELENEMMFNQMKSGTVEE